jgi:hypothetical protein
MSVSSLAASAVARRTDMNPPNAPALAPSLSATHLAAPADAPAVPLSPAFAAPVFRPAVKPAFPPAMVPAAPLASPSDEKSSRVTTALDLVSKHVPTEVLTLYVAVLAATSAGWRAFWVFLIATPVVVWLTYGAEVKAKEKRLPLHPRAWPVWEMFAGTVAYSAWAFALPNAPFNRFSWYSSALAGIAVLIASTVLSLLAPLFRRPLSA